jgi:hypothetical protein
MAGQVIPRPPKGKPASEKDQGNEASGIKFSSIRIKSQESEVRSHLGTWYLALDPLSFAVPSVFKFQSAFICVHLRLKNLLS